MVVLGDTHRSTGHGLEGRALEAVREADVVAHTGDFTTIEVYDALASEAGTLHAVVGNNDETALRDRLPSRAVFDVEGLAVAMVHGPAHSEVAMGLLGREVGADLVVAGHSHRPGTERAGGSTLLNPGSHADPRWYRAAHAELRREGEVVPGRLVQSDDGDLERVAVEPSA